jgi:hypothetical protein
MGDDGEDSYEAQSNIGLMQSVSKMVNDAVHSAALAIMHIPELAAESKLFHTQYDIRGAPLRVARMMLLLPKMIGPRKWKMTMEMVAGATPRRNERGRT